MNKADCHIRSRPLKNTSDRFQSNLLRSGSYTSIETTLQTAQNKSMDYIPMTNHTINKPNHSNDRFIKNSNPVVTSTKCLSTDRYKVPLKSNVNTRITEAYTVSIDTNSINNTDIEEKKVNSKQTTSIDTDIFFSSQAIRSHNKPIAIDETDVFKEETVTTISKYGLERIEHPLKRGPSLSLDISSGISMDVLPSVERHDRLGSGIVTEFLGAGGTAKVYKIWNEKLEVYRAAKVLLPTSQKSLMDRFLTEAKITAKLHNHNIVETYDCSEWHGLPVIEMELIEGHTLSKLISSNGVIPVPVAVAIALPIAVALHYAHSLELIIYGKKYKGIIHRDLKPSNIMITSAGRVVLMDFGVARPLEAGLHTVATNSIVGTLHYLSPEQISGCQIDHLTDIYSFGAVLYELLCGKNPFPYSDMVQMIQAKTRNQFSRLENFNLELDNRVASIAQICLRTDKKERYAHFGEIVSTLENILRSYRMGEPEEIISLFLNNPETLKTKYEQYLQNKRSSSLVKQQVCHESKNLDAIKRESIHDDTVYIELFNEDVKYQETTNHEVIHHLESNTRPTIYPSVKSIILNIYRVRQAVVIAVIILLLLLIVNRIAL